MPWSRARPAPRSAASSASRRCIRLGKQAREDGASQSDNVVGDVVEALIGALFLDGGLDAARALHPHAPGSRYLDEPAHARPQHPKSALQELAAAQRPSSAPVYEVVAPHRRAPRAAVHASACRSRRLGEATAEGLEQAGSGNRGRRGLLEQLQ